MPQICFPEKNHIGPLTLVLAMGRMQILFCPWYPPAFCARNFVWVYLAHHAILMSSSLPPWLYPTKYDATTRSVKFVRTKASFKLHTSVHIFACFDLPVSSINRLFRKPRVILGSSLLLELQLYSPSLKVNEASRGPLAVFSDHDQVGGKIVLDSRSYHTGQLTISVCVIPFA